MLPPGEAGSPVQKKALALDIEKKRDLNKVDAVENEWEGQEEDEVAPGTSAESKRRRMLATKPSDLELYERRTS